MLFGHLSTHDQNMRFRLTKKHLQIQKKLGAKKYFGELEDIYSSANKDIPFKTPFLSTVQLPHFFYYNHTKTTRKYRK
jgi:hypothetical protein